MQSEIGDREREARRMVVIVLAVVLALVVAGAIRAYPAHGAWVFFPMAVCLYLGAVSASGRPPIPMYASWAVTEKDLESMPAPTFEETVANLERGGLGRDKARAQTLLIRALLPMILGGIVAVMLWGFAFVPSLETITSNQFLECVALLVAFPVVFVAVLLGGSQWLRR